ncbi:MAG: hypothetical protein ACSLEL_04785 [Candidatus Malihini olakiniferum]
MSKTSYLENINIVPLYLTVTRSVLEYDGQLLMVNDDHTDLQPGKIFE